MDKDEKELLEFVFGGMKIEEVGIWDMKWLLEGVEDEEVKAKEVKGE